MKIFIIGTGTDGKITLTKEAENIIYSADILIGAERILKPFSGIEKKSFICWKAEEIKKIIDENSNADIIAVLMSGDCGFFSGAEKLISALENYEPEIICGISSPAYFCAKIKKPWQDMKFISLHGTENNIVRNVRRNKFCFFLLGGGVSPDGVCRRLCDYGNGNITVYIGENLSYDNEKIFTGKANEFIEMKFEKLSVLVTENPDPETSIPSGITDERFIRCEIPMTKSEIRSIVISKLNISNSDICWDIGCGTGSVSVEMALQCYSGKVFSIDKNEKAVELTKANAVQFGCDNIKVLQGNAPNILETLPAPDKIFIGGTDGKINDIIKTALNKNPHVRFVITAVSLETVSEILNMLKTFGINSQEMIQTAVTRTRKAGQHTLLSAENPIFIVKGEKFE